MVRYGMTKSAPAVIARLGGKRCAGTGDGERRPARPDAHREGAGGYTGRTNSKPLTEAARDFFATPLPSPPALHPADRWPRWWPCSRWRRTAGMRCAPTAAMIAAALIPMNNGDTAHERKKSSVPDRARQHRHRSIAAKLKRSPVLEPVWMVGIDPESKA